jgi:aspartate-semialdehyde dehydrogenase
LPLEAVNDDSFKQIDLVLASAGASVSKAWAAKAVAAGAVVIDNSSAFRMNPTVPLVVPEVNPQQPQRTRASLQTPTAQRF